MNTKDLDMFCQAQGAMGYLFYQNREMYVQLLEDFQDMLMHEEAKEMGCL